LNFPFHQMTERIRARGPRSSSVNSVPLILDIEDFKVRFSVAYVFSLLNHKGYWFFFFCHWQGDFSFDALFGNLVNDLLPSFLDEEADSGDGHGNIAGVDGLTNGHLRGQSAPLSSAPFFPEVDGLLSLFKDACKELVDLRKQVSVLRLHRWLALVLSFHRSDIWGFC